jgi:anti-anti-sigma factor
MSGHEGFHYEIEKSTDPATGTATTTIHCHGRLVATTANGLKDLVKPIIPEGGHIVLDFADLAYMDSSGLGTLVGLKATAVKEGYCRLILENLTPRVKELLSLTNLLGMFSS